MLVKENKGLVHFKDGHVESVMTHQDLGGGKVYFKTIEGEYMYEPDTCEEGKYNFYKIINNEVTLIKDVSKVELVL